MLSASAADVVPVVVVVPAVVAILADGDSQLSMVEEVTMHMEWTLEESQAVAHARLLSLSCLYCRR